MIVTLLLVQLQFVVAWHIEHMNIYMHVIRCMKAGWPVDKRTAAFAWRTSTSVTWKSVLFVPVECER